MEHKQLQIEAAKVMFPEPWTHDKGDYGRKDDPDYDGWSVFCTKCKGELFHGEPQRPLAKGKDASNPCPVPPPYIIPTDRKADPDAYDLCFGQAMRKLSEVAHADEERFDAIIEPMMYSHFAVPEDGQGDYLYNNLFLSWLLNEATPAQIWEIVIKARGK